MLFESRSEPVVGKVAIVMLCRVSLCSSVNAPVKFPFVNVSVLSSVPLTATAPSVGAVLGGGAMVTAATALVTDDGRVLETMTV